MSAMRRLVRSNLAFTVNPLLLMAFIKGPCSLLRHDFRHTRRTIAAFSRSTHLPRTSPHRLFASKQDASSYDERKLLIDECLSSIGIDAGAIHTVTMKQIEDPTAAEYGDFGKSALKCYKAWLFPKDDAKVVMNKASALRCARQIDFLLKRNASHQTQWVRHHDQSLPQDAKYNSERKLFPMVLILDNLRSAFNVGSIFRTADATACREIVTVGICPHPNGSGSDKVRKSALGAEQLVSSQHFSTLVDAVRYCRDAYPSFQLVGLETTQRSYDLHATNFNQDGVVIILGNEVTGVDTRILEELDVLVEIPVFGTKNSLNVASCAAIVMYEYIRQVNTLTNQHLKL